MYTYDEFITQSREYAARWTKQKYCKKVCTIDDTYIVWSRETCQNSKVLIATTHADNVFFEATLNNNNDGIQIIVYNKIGDGILTQTLGGN